MPQVTEIEIVSDATGGAEPPRFLRLRQLVCRNRRADGSRSRDYPVEVVDRPRLDAVAVVVWRRPAPGAAPEILLRDCLRPAAFFRREADPPLADPRVYRVVPEIVAGVLEADDRGEAGLFRRAALEVAEEAGFEVDPGEVVSLGAPFFVAPGILSEKIHPVAVEVTGRAPHPPRGDGSPLEEDGRLTWVALPALLRACLEGTVEDAKTEIGAHRLAARLGVSTGEAP